ncbi:MAG: HPr(Ser) kinase/phosphatase [Vicinamibacteria bacterium]|nr:HPr(Ser) kinase/phosphatase [Vicinamibacteria bacterium]
MKRAEIDDDAASDLPGKSCAFITVRDLLRGNNDRLLLRLLAGRNGLQRRVTLSRIQRPGLALAGYTEYLRYGRVQILGGSEINYIATLDRGRRARAMDMLTQCQVSCFVVTKGQKPPAELLRRAESRRIPVFVTPLDSTPFIKQLSIYLERRLAPQVESHAVLMDVSGLGVLIIGESGIGKSECALDLVDRGHRLVADDVTTIQRTADGLIGFSPDLTRHHMELRGLGIINIKDIYGVSATRGSMRVELVVMLEKWETGREYDRLGLKSEGYRIMGVELPLVRMPVAPGRNIAILIEVAARNQLLKNAGRNASRRLADRVDRMARDSRRSARRTRTMGRPRSTGG